MPVFMIPEKTADRRSTGSGRGQRGGQMETSGWFPEEDRHNNQFLLSQYKNCTAQTRVTLDVREAVVFTSRSSAVTCNFNC